jgi:DNA-directed RNA polymerase specialized sigma24 family protein
LGQIAFCQRSAQQGDTQGGHEIDTVTRLAAFERFVFVMAILERYSNRDCARLLGCSMNKVAQARMRALRQLAELAALVPRSEGPPLLRLEITA